MLPDNFLFHMIWWCLNLNILKLFFAKFCSFHCSHPRLFLSVIQETRLSWSIAWDLICQSLSFIYNGWLNMLLLLFSYFVKSMAGLGVYGMLFVQRLLLFLSFTRENFLLPWLLCLTLSLDQKFRSYYIRPPKLHFSQLIARVIWKLRKGYT